MIRISVAKPGKSVRLLLRGCKIQWIQKGDILGPPSNDPRRASTTAYFLIILPVLLTVVFVCLCAAAGVETIQELWDSGELTEPFLLLIALKLFFVGGFLHYNWRKVFYCRYLFRMVSFCRAHDIPWTQVPSIALIRDKKNA